MLEMTLEEFRIWAKKVKWTWAKTRAKTNPHWYVMRDPMIPKVARFIWENKVWYYYRPTYSWYPAIVVDGWRYWLMDYPPERADIINKVPHKPEDELLMVKCEGCLPYYWKKEKK